jgi:hypothetical protein
MTDAEVRRTSEAEQLQEIFDSFSFFIPSQSW